MTNSLERLPAACSPPPTLLRGALFRLAFVYWGLFALVNVFTNSIDLEWFEPVARALGAFGEWVGKAILAIPYEFSGVPNGGSGDKTSDWVLLLCIATIALLATVVWSLLDRRRAHDARLREGLRVLVRYSLAFSLLVYGLAKVFFGQFPTPAAGRLVQRFGDASPMGLLWTFMGASPAYVFFSGAMETLGAGLLLFRRTTTLGALLLVPVMTNVVLMNFCYDVPVKIYSSHYLGMCIFLLLPDVRRLANVLVLERVAQPVARDPVLAKRGMRVARRVVKYGVIGIAVFVTLKGAIADYAATPANEPEPTTWYDGNWMVTSFHRDGREVPTSVAEIKRWRRVRFLIKGSKITFRWRDTDESIPFNDLYDAVIDEQARTITLTFDKEQNDARHPGPGLDIIALRYTRIDDTHLALEGKVGTEVLSVQLERADTSKMLLVTRGFHWINETPFNR